MNDQHVWNQALDALAQKISTMHIQMFFRHARLIHGSSGIIELHVGSAYAQQIISQRYSKIITETLRPLLGHQPQLRIIVDPNILPSKKAGADTPLFPQNANGMRPPTPMKKTLLRPDFTFANFAVSPSNQLANAAALAVAKNPGGAYNPLFLYGSVGVGKTHLMQAVGNAVFAKNPSIKIIYCTGEEFTNDLILAIQTKSTGEFKRRYRNIHLFLVDDIQFIAGKNSVQEEFFHTFNALLRVGNQIILTADQAPNAIQQLEARLRSRFEAGMIADLLPPDFELRTAILLIKAKNLGIQIDMQTAQEIAGRAEGVRQMEGILTQLLAIASMQNEPITIDLVRKHIQKTLRKEEQKHHISPQDVLETILSFYHLSASQIREHKRDRLVVRPRQVAMYLLRKELRVPYKEIGQLLGGRDHSTVMHGVEKVESLLQKDVHLHGDIARIKQRLWG